MTLKSSCEKSAISLQGVSASEFREELFLQLTNLKFAVRFVRDLFVNLISKNRKQTESIKKSLKSTKGAKF